MARTAAFIGHSFSKVDEEVVSRFLKFFDHLQGLQIDFSWDHAEAAEPKILSQKVREKMEGKNLFIGICTAKEYAIDPSALSRGCIWRQRLSANGSAFQKKTSDWITQEIGYAIAKDMRLLLLIEEEVKVPGGLQGDIEYITFKRNSPPESFEKILEMIMALGPKLANIEKSTSPTPSQQGPTEKRAQDGASDLTPDSNWTMEQYENAIFLSALERNVEALKSLLATFSQTIHGTVEMQRDLLEGYSIWARYLIGTEESLLHRLEELEKKHDNEPQFKRYLARCYQRLGSGEMAVAKLTAAASLESDVEKKVIDLREAASAMAKLGNKQAEEWLRAEVGAVAGEPAELRSLLRRGLLDLASINESDAAWIAYQEARLSDFPDNVDDRFALAYKYSTKGNDTMALYHYLLIPESRRTETTWNNIGVGYRNLEMPARSVHAYRKSQEKGGTLAVSNLAYLFLEAGFFREAEDMCMDALKMKGADKRVAAALASIDDRTKAEDEKAKSAASTGKTEHAYMTELGNAMCATALSNSKSSWVTEKCTLTVDIVGSSFKGFGTYERVVSEDSFRFLLADAKRERKTLVVTYEGTVTGRGVSFTRREHEEGTTPGLLSSGGESGFLILDEDFATAQEMIRKDKDGPTYHTWTRK